VGPFADLDLGSGHPALVEPAATETRHIDADLAGDEVRLNGAKRNACASSLWQQLHEIASCSQSAKTRAAGLSLSKRGATSQ
jgi:hypothetical protein